MEWRIYTYCGGEQFYDSRQLHGNGYSGEWLYSDIEYYNHIEHHATDCWHHAPINHSTYVYHYFNWLNSYRGWNVQLE